MNPQVDTELYDRDFCEWVRHNVDLLRRGCVHQADLAHIAEELEALANSDERAVNSRLIVLIMHLLKWKLQPEGRYFESGKSSWLSTIIEQRRRLAELLEYSPSLKPFAVRSLRRNYPIAVRRASAEAGIPIRQFPAECPFTFEQVLDYDYLPD